MEIRKKTINFIKDNRMLLGIMLLAVIVRLAYLFILHPPLTWSDSSLYDETAWNVVNGHGYTYPQGVAFAGREPGYALFFLAPVYFIFGHSVFAAQIMQVLLSLGIIGMVFFLGKKFFDQRVALLAASIYAVWPADVVFDPEIMTEIPSTFLLLLFAISLVLGLKNKSSKMIFTSGLILGAATLTRFTTVLLPLAILPLFLLEIKPVKASVKYFALMCAGFLLLITPWFVRNHIELGKFVFGRTGSGAIYWSGSYIPWDGEWKGFEVPPLNTMIEQKNVFNDDTVLKKETIKNIKENPVGVMKIWLKKPFKNFLKSPIYGQIAHSERVSRVFNTNKLLGLACKGGLLLVHILLMFASVVGLICSFNFKRSRVLNLIFLAFLAYFVVVLLPMNPEPRYQIPLMPYFIILASVGVLKSMKSAKNFSKGSSSYTSH